MNKVWGTEGIRLHIFWRVVASRTYPDSILQVWNVLRNKIIFLTSLKFSNEWGRDCGLSQNLLKGWGYVFTSLKQGRERIRWARRGNCTEGGTDVTGTSSRYFKNCEPTPCSWLTFAVFFRLFSSFQLETLPHQDYAFWSPESRAQMPTLLPSKAELQLDCVLAYLLPFPTLFPLIPLFWKNQWLHYIHLSPCLTFCLYGVQLKKSYN